MASLSAIGRVLSNRNARIFFAGSLTSWTGLWMQRIAAEWLAWQLTHSPLWVGVMAFCNLGPSVIASPLAGAAADRLDRVRMTISSQLVSAIHATVLAVLVLTGLIRIEIMAALEVVLGVGQAFSQPARQTLIPALVPRADLPGAVALNSLCYNLARFVGPAIAGPIIAAWGVVPAMAVNALAYFYASATMPTLRLPAAARRGNAQPRGIWADAVEGITYVARHPGLGPLVAYAAVMGMTVRAIPEMLPPFVDHLFHRGAPGLATLASAMGLAALVGGLIVAARGRLQGLSRVALDGGFLLAIGAAGFVATSSFSVAVACAAVMGAATTIHGIAVQTLLQSATAPGVMGRVLSLWGMITRAGPALGALLIGAASELVGLRVPVLIAASLCIVMFLVTRPRLEQMERALESGNPPA